MPSPNPSLRFGLIDTAWGTFGFVTRGGRLAATWLPQGQRAARQRIAEAWPDATEDGSILFRFRREVTEYFRGQSVRFSPPVDLDGLPGFRGRVLEACRRVPFGATASYADLARAVGSPAASRAVGGAMATNPLPLVVPCHRILRADGSIGGFSSRRGVDEKRRLLRLEGIRMVGDKLMAVDRDAVEDRGSRSRSRMKVAV